MNQKEFANIALIVLVVVLAGVAGYFALNNRSITPTPTSWQFIDANSFSLSLPPGWKFNKLQGIDSYVGEFVGDGAKLSFDFGWYSNSLAEDDDPNYVVTYETIGDYRAKIVVPKVTSNGTTGIYFGDLGNQNRFNLYGSNFTASQQQTALKIFRTIKFKKSARFTPIPTTKYDDKKVTECVSNYQSEQERYNSSFGPGYIVVGFPSSTSIVLAKEIIKSHGLTSQETNVGYYSRLYANVPVGQEFLWACRLKQDARIRYADPSPSSRIDI